MHYCKRCAMPSPFLFSGGLCSKCFDPEVYRDEPLPNILSDDCMKAQRLAKRKDVRRRRAKLKKAGLTSKGKPIA